MSNKDLDRLDVLKRIKEGLLKQIRGAEMLKISSRQVRRLLHRFKTEGNRGVISRKIGVPSNNRLPKEIEAKIIDFFQNKDHYDFGPTLAHEYLTENEGVQCSLSSVRHVMIRNGLWHPHEVRAVHIHHLRPRRDKVGELIQLDGSEHEWFEARGPRCTLLVFIDDATSTTLHLKFVKSENTLDYFAATREYIEKHGRPAAFYPDKHGVFRVNRSGALSGDGLTQFGRAMEELDIRLICANSPQAKGRVERRNRDFQNRLIKAMRIAKISTIEAANAFLPSFLKKFNQKFSQVPKNPINAHRPLLVTHNLDKIFCIKETRRLSKNLTLQHNNVIYQVIAPRQEYTLRGAEVTIFKTNEGAVSIECRGKLLTAVPYHKMQARSDVVSAKELITALSEKKVPRYKHKPGRHHPWRRYRRKRVNHIAEQVVCS